MSLSRREYIRQNTTTDKTGENPEQTPVELSGGDPPLTLREEMRRFVREQISLQQGKEDNPTFEEEDDFTEDEDTGDLVSAYTVHELVSEDLDQPEDLEGAPNDEDRAAQEASEIKETELPHRQAPFTEEDHAQLKELSERYQSHLAKPGLTPPSET